MSLISRLSPQILSIFFLLSQRTFHFLIHKIFTKYNNLHDHNYIYIYIYYYYFIHYIKYRTTNVKSKYKPQWPQLCNIIIILFITWNVTPQIWKVNTSFNDPNFVYIIIIIIILLHNKDEKKVNTRWRKY